MFFEPCTTMSFDFSSFFTISGIVFCESTYKQVEKDDLPFWVSCHNSINSSSFKAICLLFPNETPQRKHVAKRNGIMVYLSSVPGIVRKPPPKLANEPPNHYEAGFWPPIFAKRYLIWWHTYGQQANSFMQESFPMTSWLVWKCSMVHILLRT